MTPVSGMEPSRIHRTAHARKRHHVGQSQWNHHRGRWLKPELPRRHPDAKTTFKLRAYKQVSAALRNADIVVMSIQPGPMKMFANDLDIPAQYGIRQNVGDSTGPGGISRALRTIPIYTD